MIKNVIKLTCGALASLGITTLVSQKPLDLNVGTVVYVVVFVAVGLYISENKQLPTDKK